MVCQFLSMRWSTDEADRGPAPDYLFKFIVIGQSVSDMGGEIFEQAAQLDLRGSGHG